jgi:hypothetical protein
MQRRPRDEESDSSSASDEEVEEAFENSHSEDESADNNVPDPTALNKADLVALCRRLRLKTTGTKDQLIARVEKHRKSERKQEKVNLHPEISHEQLQQMNVADLRALATRLRVSPEGTKSEILKRIKEVKDTNPQSGNKDDGWEAALAIYAPRLKLSEMALDWGVAPVLLTPAIWPILLWRMPIDKALVYGHIGTDGTLVEALMKRWGTLLDADALTNRKIRGYWVTIWTLVHAARFDTSATPLSWCRENWELHVTPVIKEMRLLQAQRLASSGQTRAAQ